MTAAQGQEGAEAKLALQAFGQTCEPVQIACLLTHLPSLSWTWSPLQGSVFGLQAPDVSSTSSPVQGCVRERRHGWCR